MDYTPNLNLRKPARTDPVLIADLNDNMDILDQEVQDVWDTLDQEITDVRNLLDQEVQDIWDLLDNLFVEEGADLNG